MVLTLPKCLKSDISWSSRVNSYVSVQNIDVTKNNPKAVKIWLASMSSLLVNSKPVNQLITVKTSKKLSLN